MLQELTSKCQQGIYNADIKCVHCEKKIYGLFGNNIYNPVAFCSQMCHLEYNLKAVLHD
jgi:hypothetical protein